MDAHLRQLEHGDQRQGDAAAQQQDRLDGVGDDDGFEPAQDGVDGGDDRDDDDGVFGIDAEEVLEDLGVESQRVIQVFNKTDLLGETVRRSKSQDEDSPRGEAVWVSAFTGDGLEDLKTEIARRLDRLETTPAESPADTDRLALP